MTRTVRTPAQRAEVVLAVAERTVARLITTRDKHKAALNAADADLDKARIRLGYLKQNPDLPQPKEPTK